MTDKGFGLGGNVVLQMIENVNMQPGQHAVFDNFLGQLHYLKNLHQKKNSSHLHTQRRQTLWSPSEDKKDLR